MKFMEKLARDNPTVADVLLRLSLAPVSVAVGMVVRQVLAHSFGADELPVYIFFFPMVMLTAVLAGFWPGIASMVLSALVCSYILFNTPFGSKPEISPAEEVGLIFFVLSSIFISVLASLYRRHRERIAFHEREAALNASRLQAAAEWEHTFNSITDPVALLDTENLIVRANTAMAALQFMSVGQCSGQPCYLSQLCEEQLGADSPYALTLADGQRHVADVRIVSQGLDYTVSASPYRNEQGRIESIILVAHDITVRKHIESVLIANEERLNLALHAAKAGTWELDLAGC